MVFHLPESQLYTSASYCFTRQKVTPQDLILEFWRIQFSFAPIFNVSEHTHNSSIWRQLVLFILVVWRIVSLPFLRISSLPVLRALLTFQLIESVASQMVLAVFVSLPQLNTTLRKLLVIFTSLRCAAATLFTRYWISYISNAIGLAHEAILVTIYSFSTRSCPPWCLFYAAVVFPDYYVSTIHDFPLQSSALPRDLCSTQGTY